MPLNWTCDADDGRWGADGTDEYYEIGVLEDGTFATYGPWEWPPDGGPSTFPTLADAKAHCQAHEDALIAEVAREIEEADPCRDSS